MSLFKHMCLVTLVLLQTTVLSAQEVMLSDRTKAPKSKKSKTWEYRVGLGYVQWSEQISISRASLTSQGISTYAGPSLLLEVGSLAESWSWAAGAGAAFGRAASGAYDGALTFDDGTNRAWTAYSASLSGAWRINKMISIGGALAGHYRKVDWEPQDRTLLVESRDPIAIYPRIDLRFRLASKVEFVQSYAPLSFNRESLWTWASYWVL